MESWGKREAKETPEAELGVWVWEGRETGKQSLTWISEQAQLRFRLPPLLNALTYVSSLWRQQSSRFFVPTCSTETATLVLLARAPVPAAGPSWHKSTSPKTCSTAPGSSCNAKCLPASDLPPCLRGLQRGSLYFLMLQWHTCNPLTSLHHLNVN